MSKRVDKLLNITIGELRQEVALEDADTLVKDWLESWENQEAFDDIDYEEENEECWDEDEECYDEEEEYSSEPGDEELPSQEEEDLAVSIAADIDDGKYNISTIVGLYSQDIIDRVKYLID